jgi:hypothetical protein
MASEWMKVMLEEISRKKAEGEEARAEQQRRLDDERHINERHIDEQRRPGDDSAQG